MNRHVVTHFKVELENIFIDTFPNQEKCPHCTYRPRNSKPLHIAIHMGLMHGYLDELLQETLLVESKKEEFAKMSREGFVPRLERVSAARYLNNKDFTRVSVEEEVIPIDVKEEKKKDDSDDDLMVVYDAHEEARKTPEPGRKRVYLLTKTSRLDN